MCARCKERSDGIAIATKSIASSSPLREQMRGNTRGRGGYPLEMFALTHSETFKNCDILMHSKKEKTTGFVAYLLYVRDLWFVSAEARR